MGAWASGLLDNDNSLDGLGDLTFGIRAEVTDAKDPARAAAAVGLLLQFSPFDFSPDNELAAELQVAVGGIESKAFSESTRALLKKIAAGEGAALADLPAKVKPAVAKLLHESGRSGFGERQAALFDSKAGAAYVQELADACLESIEGDLEEEDIASDLCREAASMGALGMLVVLEPVKLPKKKLEKLRTLAAAGLKRLEESGDGELEFQREYHACVDGVFAELIARTS